jgi:hypothetical protein
LDFNIFSLPPCRRGQGEGKYFNFCITLAFLNFGSEIPPVIPFSKEGELFSPLSRQDPIFSPFERGIKGDLMTFQNAKLLPIFYKFPPPEGRGLG